MTAGVIIINDGGTIQIDDTFPTLCLRSKGSGTIGSGGYLYLADFGTGKLALRSTSMVGYTWSNALDPYPAGYFIFGPVGATVEWFIFDNPQEPGSSFGFQVRNAAGQLMYDVGAKPLRMIDIKSGGSRPAWQGTFGYAGGRNYAVLPMVTAFDSANTFTRVGGGSPDEFFQREDINLSGGSVNGGTIVLGMTATVRRTYGPFTGAVLPTSYNVNTNNAALSVIDVTNY